jgi:hypothetical protein
VLGSNEQIFGADKQVPKGSCGRCPKKRGNSVRASKEVFGPTRNAERKGEYRDIRPALLTGPSQQWLGPFSVHGSDEQIFGVNEQILGPDQSG